MARKDSLDTGDKARLLRALAHEIHRKQPPEDVLTQHFTEQSRLGRHRGVRAAAEVLEGQGFAAALAALGAIGDEAAIVLAVLVDGKDHRQTAAALNALADHLEQAGGY